VAKELGDVAGDAAKLAELQMRLFGVEARQCIRQLIVPVAIFAGAAIVAACCTGIVLFAIGSGLHEVLGLPLWISLLVAAGLGAGGAGAAVYYAKEQLSTSKISFEKSKEELMRNVSLLSRVLRPK
jgi:hypothetical protein